MNEVQFAGTVNDNICVHTDYLTVQQMLVTMHIQE